MTTPTVHIIVKRQDAPGDTPYSEHFLVPRRPNMNVISALMEIQRRPVTREGRTTRPVVWECNCLEEVCGACTVLINGRPRQACSALVDRLPQPIRLAPLTKFPVVRDLMVDRAVMFASLKKVRAWIDIDGTHGLGPGPRIAPRVQEENYPLSRCMTCGCCMEACPNVNDKSPFIGPAAVAQVGLFNSHPSGSLAKEERLAALMGPGGIAGCGNSQNCVRACPKEIPLTTSLARLNGEVNRFALSRLLGR